MRRILELTVPDLCCADEAQQIWGAVSRLPGVNELQTAIGARKVIVAYEPERATPETIRAAIHGLGMRTVTEAGSPASQRRRPLADLLGWAFVSIIAILALAGIVGERLGLVEARSGHSSRTCGSRPATTWWASSSPPPVGSRRFWPRPRRRYPMWS